MGRKVKGIDTRRRIRVRDRKDDIPDCPNLDSTIYAKDSSESFESELPMPVYKKQRQRVNLTNEDILPDNFSDYIRQKRAEPNASDLCPDCRESVGSRCGFDSSFNSSQQQFGGDWARGANGLRGRLVNKKAGKFMEHLGAFLVELCACSVSMVRYASNYPKPTAIGLIFFGLYFSVAYLETSIAAAIELIGSVLWPILHVVLRSVEHLFQMISDMISSADDLSQAVYCDTASTWCTRFNLMCHKQCSYTSMALERLRRQN